jgi:hypothetical protein
MPYTQNDQDIKQLAALQIIIANIRELAQKYKGTPAGDDLSKLCGKSDA